MAKNDFAKVISAAVEDVAEHGYDSEERLNKWMDKIRRAAPSALPSEDQLQKALRDALIAKYRDMVDKGKIAKLHPGVSKFDIKMLTPKMQDELQKRIMVSAKLIKLNRQKAIDQTLQRFAGWMSSVPSGGTKQTNKKDQTKDIRKALSALPYEERRLLVDQGHKLVASISEVIATNTHAIAMVWHSNWRQPGYDYRDEHKERDQKVYLLRESWARDKGLVKPGDVGFYDDITKVAEEPFCRCYAQWVYNIRDLPKDMLTKKGATALREARSTIRAMNDSDDQKASKSTARYVPAIMNLPATHQCIQCTMFREPNRCTAVDGDIERGGLCDYFEADVVAMAET